MNAKLISHLQNYTWIRYFACNLPVSRVTNHKDLLCILGNEAQVTLAEIFKVLDALLTFTVYPGTNALTFALMIQKQ